MTPFGVNAGLNPIRYTTNVTKDDVIRDILPLFLYDTCFFFCANILLTLFSTLRLRAAQMFSIGLRSGLYDGHVRIRLGRCAWRSSRTSFDVCLGSLSCWKTQRCRPYILVALA